MTTRALAAMLLAAGCGSGSEEERTIGAFQAVLDDARSVVASHGDAVGSAGTLEEVSGLEEDYATDWQGIHDQMQQRMDEVGRCGMSGDMSSMMDDAAAMMGQLDDDVDAHMVDHDAHTDVAQCRAAEIDHENTMGDGLDQMSSDADGWADSGMMSCGSGM